LWWIRKHARFAGFVRGFSGSRERRLHNARHGPRGERTFDLLQGPKRQAETDQKQPTDGGDDAWRKDTCVERAVPQ